MFSKMAFEKEIYDFEYKKASSMRDCISEYPEDWPECDTQDLVKGDIVYVEYFSDSQTDIYTHTPEYGIVQTIEEVAETDLYNKTKKVLSVIIMNHNGDLVDIVKGNLSIYSRGYFINIKKYVLRHPKTPSFSDCGGEYISSDENYSSE